jgi:hypothetical protein
VLARRTAPRLLAATLVAAVVAALAPATAHADEASDAPVTADDRVSVRGTSFAIADVLANDTDPNGDELRICRVDVPRGVPLSVEIGRGGNDEPMTGREVEGEGDVLGVVPMRNRTGTHRITYYACDTRYLTPATLTVTVKAEPEVTARKVDGKPGRVRFSNPTNRTVVVLYGGPRADEPDGRFRLTPRTGRTVTVDRRRIVYIAFARRTGEPVGFGFVRDIRRPARDAVRTTARPSLGARELHAWRTSR